MSEGIFSTEGSKRNKNKIQTREAGKPKPIQKVEEFDDEDRITGDPKNKKEVKSVELTGDDNRPARTIVTGLRSQVKMRLYSPEKKTVRKTLNLKEDTVDSVESVINKIKKNKRSTTERLDIHRTLRDSAVIDTIFESISEVLKSRIGEEWEEQVPEHVISSDDLKDWLIATIETGNVDEMDH